MGRYHVAQVCMNGHSVTGRLDTNPELRAAHCKICGAATIEACTHCGTPIRGKYENTSVIDLTCFTPPHFCHECGRAFPWTQARLAAAKELAAELPGLEEGDRTTLAGSLDDIVSDTPRTELASDRTRRILAKVGDGARQALSQVLTSIATEAAKKLIWPL